MSHLTKAEIEAKFICADECIKNIKQRIAELRVRAETKEKILSDYKVFEVEKTLEKLAGKFTEENFNHVKQIYDRVNTFFSAVDTYVAYNFNLDLDDYNNAIGVTSEMIMGSTDEVVEKALLTTKDELLKGYIKATAMGEKFDDSSALIEKATKEMENSSLYKKEQAKRNVETIFKERNVKLEDEKLSINETITKANAEINSASLEKAVRNRVIVSIIKTVKEQGFIIKKENVEECGEYAKVSAVKPNGEQANFVIYLDGKFIYKFQEYEGLSCETDIANFEEKFERIYGIKLDKKEIMWSNPDRLGKMAHQTISNKKIGG